MSAAIPLIPGNAPFSASQRAWLNGFLAGLYGAPPPSGTTGPGSAPAPEDEDFPWHDPAVDLPGRQALAADRALPARLMACMAQLDCGRCGYLCRSYAEALATGAETSLSLCIPGAGETKRALKVVLAEQPPIAPPLVAAPVAAPGGPKGAAVRVLSAIRLTAPASAKDVRRVVVDLTGSGLAYEPGDSLGVHAQNDPGLVAACLVLLGASGEEAVPGLAGESVCLRTALLEERDIGRPLDRVLELLAGAAHLDVEARALRALAEGEEGAAPEDADLLDLLHGFPSARPSSAALVAALPVLKFRLYSIASSPLVAQDRVELCVSVVRTERRGRIRDGIASCHLGHRCGPEAPLRAFVQSSSFRLPADDSAPLIMVGPGTGIAPFRAFLQHRAMKRLTGGTWLFFGERHEASEFLFRDDLQAWHADGTLERLSLAWSRDGTQRTYVQDRMSAHAAELWRWLQEGAHFYVCGDAAHMARDVDTALRRIVTEQGGLTPDQAHGWLLAFERQGRYRRDVY